jgi:hypothetical protein
MADDRDQLAVPSVARVINMSFAGLCVPKNQILQ